MGIIKINFGHCVGKYGPGPKLPNIFCAGIGPLQLGVVLVDCLSYVLPCEQLTPEKSVSHSQIYPWPLLSSKEQFPPFIHGSMGEQAVCTVGEKGEKTLTFIYQNENYEAKTKLGKSMITIYFFKFCFECLLMQFP